jgi:DNA gyrase subunit A
LFFIFWIAEFSLSEKQAEAILDISLRRLTLLEVTIVPSVIFCLSMRFHTGTILQTVSCEADIILIVQGKKFVEESKSLMEQITKLEELLSSRGNILQVTKTPVNDVCFLFFWRFLQVS